MVGAWNLLKLKSHVQLGKAYRFVVYTSSYASMDVSAVKLRKANILAVNKPIQPTSNQAIIVWCCHVYWDDLYNHAWNRPLNGHNPMSIPTIELRQGKEQAVPRNKRAWCDDVWMMYVLRSMSFCGRRWYILLLVVSVQVSAVSNRHDNQFTMIMLMLDNNNIICHIWSDWPPRKMWVNKKKVRWRFARLPLLIIIDTQNICSTITAAARYYSASIDSRDIDRQCMFGCCTAARIVNWWLLWLMYLD